MAIKLLVDDYCDGCGEFEPECVHNDYYSGYNDLEYSDINIFCEHRKVCKRIYNHIITKTVIENCIER